MESAIQQMLQKGNIKVFFSLLRSDFCGKERVLLLHNNIVQNWCYGMSAFEARQVRQINLDRMISSQKHAEWVLKIDLNWRGKHCVDFCDQVRIPLF